MGLEGVKDHVTQGIQVRDISSLEDNWTRSGGKTEHFWWQGLEKLLKALGFLLNILCRCEPTIIYIISIVLWFEPIPFRFVQEQSLQPSICIQ